MPTSPQNGVEHVCFMGLALLGGFKANFKNLAHLAPFHPLKKAKISGPNVPMNS